MEIERDDSRIVGKHGQHRSTVRVDGEVGDGRPVIDPDGWPVTHETAVTDVDEITLPRGGVSVVGGDRLPQESSTTLTEGDVVVAESPVTSVVRVDGRTRVSVDDQSCATLHPSGNAAVGWVASDGDDGPAEISLPSRDPAGVAAAVEAAAVSLPETETPERTWPAARNDAPVVIDSGRDRGISPSEVDRPDTGVELRLPDSLEFVVGTATLAVYTGAEVSVDGNATEARLRAAGSEWSLGSDPDAVDRRASSWLRRVFHLDCHVRAAGQHGSRLQNHDSVLAAVEADAETLYELPLAERVARYLTADDRVDDKLPAWPEVLHVEPEVDQLTSVVGTLGRLPDVRLPRARQMELPDMLYQERAREAIRGPESVNQPTLRLAPSSTGEAAVVGWAAPGKPAGSFNFSSSPAPSPSTARDDGPLRSTIIECGDERGGETAQKWRETVGDGEIDLSVVSNPTVAQLRECLRDDRDVIHVAGHDPGEGIVCADGETFDRLDVPSTVGARVVVWNVCGSEALARETTEAGADASIGTLGTLYRADARDDGADLAGLLSHGWCVERAVDLLRRKRSPLGWAVVGDGATRVARSPAVSPPLVVVDTDERTVSVDHRSPDSPGSWVCDVLAQTDRLPGTETHELTDDTTANLRDRLDSPVVIDDELCWPQTL